ncbi:uncharacterized protein LOC111345379 [Stylophora pistillata]|uniref:uncharacterized protein LOC111345379 n=1 Tax=Stylophora pistillata TaxID=50429 RepID=UPI000C0421D2|nr:uncharacterized protein LOC111345379 [Stylophora pistillata]
MFWKMFFLAFMIGHSNQCFRDYAEMKLLGIKDTCQRIVNGTGRRWLKIRCHHYIRRYCTVWCRDFAHCLGQSFQWQQECARRFDKLYRWGQRTNIKTNAERDGASYNIDMRLCWWNFVYTIFSIKITLINSAVQGNGEQQKGDDLRKEDLLNSLRSITEHFTEEIRNKSENKLEKIEEMFLELTSLETSVLEKAQLNLNHTTHEFNMSSVHVDVLVRKIVHQNESHHFHLEEPKGENFLSIPPRNLYNGLNIYFNIPCFLIDYFFS